jgi:hypothetical protein
VIFAPDLAAKISLGHKTVTRRPVKREECLYRPGNTYAVQLWRGGYAVDRIRVLDVRRETITFPLTEDEAHREGFDAPAEFEEKWRSLYGDDGPRDVWRIEFEYVDEGYVEELT